MLRGAAGPRWPATARPRPRLGSPASPKSWPRSMADAASRFAYVALNDNGRRIVGEVTARDESAAFDLLKSRGLSPMQLRAAGSAASGAKPAAANLADRDLAAFLADLGALLRA